jgi:hypothetical protein
MIKTFIESKEEIQKKKRLGQVEEEESGPITSPSL